MRRFTRRALAPWTSICFLTVVPLLMCAPQAWAGVVHEVPTQGGVAHRAVLSGDWIAWGERGLSDSTGSLYIQQISTGQITQFGIDPNPIYGPRAQLNAWAPWHPAIGIDGDYVVWSDSRRTAANQPVAHIRSYNLATGVETILSSMTPSDGSQHQFPAIADGQVVWQTWNAGGGSAMAIQTAAADGSGAWSTFHSFPNSPWPIADIGGQWVVWKNDSDLSIYGQRLTDDTATVINAGLPTDSPRAPVTNGRYVVWATRDESGPQHINRIMGYDLLTDTEFVILADTGSPEHKSNVAISDRYVVWEDWRQNPIGEIERVDLEVWAYDLLTGQSFAVATGPGLQHEPWIDGDRVIWIDEFEGTRRIMWTVIPEPTTSTVLLLLAGTTLLRRRRR
jgi:hypothetical protein